MNLEPVTSLLDELEPRPSDLRDGSTYSPESRTDQQGRHGQPPFQGRQEATSEEFISDSCLLQEFQRSRDEAAFRAIVERHGALVLGVALRTLHDRQLSEDAFQATFLILASKARTIRKRASLASWLHGVARRVALRSLQQRYRRGEETLTHEPVMDTSPFEAVGTVWEQQVLDEELQRLPESWREALVLHELEGLSCRETAERLGLTLTAVEGRLKRGRKELKHRLLRRGIGVAAVMAAVQTTQAGAAAAPSVDLIAATVHAGVQATSTAGGSLEAADSLTTSQQLATQELIAMTTLKTSTLVGIGATLAVAVGVIGGGWAMSRTADAAGFSVYSVALLAADGDDAVERVADNPFDLEPVEAIPVSVEKENAVKAERAEILSRLTYDLAGRKPTDEELDAFVNDKRTLRTAVHAAVDRLLAGRPTDSPLVSSFTEIDPTAPTSTAIAAALEQKTELDFFEVPLAEALSHIWDRHNINIVIDHGSLRRASIPNDAPVSIEVSGITLQSALKLMLDPISLKAEPRDEVLVIAYNDQAGGRGATVDYRAMSPGERHIREMLEQSTEFEFIDTPLVDVTTYLSELHGVPIVLNEVAIMENGVDLNTPVNLVLSNVSFESGLNRILRQNNLDIVVRDEVLEITSEEAAERLMETRVYELRQLPAEFKPEDIARVIVRTIRPESWGKNPWVYILPTASPGEMGGIMGGGYGAGDMAEEYGGDYGGEEYEDFYAGDGNPYGESDLSKPIEAGGANAAVETLPGCLVITHCQRAHREIGDLLNQLHRIPQPNVSRPPPKSDPFGN